MIITLTNQNGVKLAEWGDEALNNLARMDIAPNTVVATALVSCDPRTGVASMRLEIRKEAP